MISYAQDIHYNSSYLLAIYYDSGYTLLFQLFNIHYNSSSSMIPVIYQNSSYTPYFQLYTIFHMGQKDEDGYYVEKCHFFQLQILNTLIKEPTQSKVKKM